MRSRDVRATTAGVLFIAATAASLIATAFLGSLLNEPNFLATVALHQDRLAAALFQLLAAFTSAAIAVTLYPVLRQYAAATALGAVAFRVIEGVFYALAAAATLILVTLSAQLTAGASAHAPAVLVRDLRDAAGCVGVLAFCTGATLYYLIFYRSQLIPRWLSLWGLAGTVLCLTAGLLVLFQSITVLSSHCAVQHAGSAQPPPRRTGDSPGGVADREGVQPPGEDTSAGRGTAESSLRSQHQSHSTAADRPQPGRRDDSHNTHSPCTTGRSSARQPAAA